MQFLFKTVALALQIFGSLRILRQLAFLGFFDQFCQFTFSYLFQSLTTGKNVHRQFFIIHQVDFVHLVQHVNVFHQRDLVSFQHVHDLIYIDFSLIISVFQICKFISLFFEEAEQTLFFFLRIKALELTDQTADQSADLAKILCFHTFQSFFGKICHLLLRARTIL